VGGVDTLLPLIAVLRGTACPRSLRNLVISILGMAGHVSIAAALRHTAATLCARSGCSQAGSNGQ
jgi:hypothetical protein